MGVNGFVRVTTIWSVTNSSNNKTLRLKFGGTTYISTTLTASSSYTDVRKIKNAGVVNSQKGFSTGAGGGVGATAGAIVTSAVDTSSSFNISLTAQLANAGETITLEEYVVELVYIP
jgi:hypothetical protein